MFTNIKWIVFMFMLYVLFLAIEVVSSGVGTISAPSLTWGTLFTAATLPMDWLPNTLEFVKYFVHGFGIIMGVWLAVEAANNVRNMFRI